jgi:Ribbon-helix-helix protein, copG family.
MAMTLRLSEADDKLLTERAAIEKRSKQEIATEAIHTYLTRRSELFRAALDHVMVEDKELLDRLADE